MIGKKTSPPSSMRDSKIRGASDKDKILAIRKGHLHLVRQYINSTNVQYKFPDDGGTALHCACVYDQLDIVKYLLEAGADPTMTDNWWRRPHDLTRSEPIKNLLKNYMESVEPPSHLKISTPASTPLYNGGHSFKELENERVNEVETNELREEHHESMRNEVEDDASNAGHYMMFPPSMESSAINSPSSPYQSIEQEEIERLRKLLNSKDQEINLLKDNMKDAERMIQSLNQEIMRNKRARTEESRLLHAKVGELFSILQKQIQ